MTEISKLEEKKLALRNIVFENEPVLRKNSRTVTVFDERLGMLLDDMKDTMYKNNGVGLAAVQVGILKKAIVIDIGDGLIEAINPEIIETSGTQTDVEGCLSCPGERGIVTRPQKVKVKAQDRNGKEFTMEATGLLARAFCHETDHLVGRIFKDVAEQMLESDEDF